MRFEVKDSVETVEDNKACLIARLRAKVDRLIGQVYQMLQVG